MISNTSSTKLKHITLCTNLFGGAGIGSFRRVKNLRKYTDLDAKLYALCGPRHYQESGFVEYLLDDQEWQVFWKDYIDKSHTPLKRLPGYRAQEFFANWLETNENIWNHILDEADILHLHWNNALFNYKNSSLLAFDKPIIWTFADMYWFTGGCHYSESCEGYKTDCASCPLLGEDKEHAKLNWEKKFNFFRSLKNISIVCPSRWLADKAKESSILKGFDINVINNPNDEDLKPYNSKIAKLKLNTGLDKYTMLVGAAAHSNKRKGMDILAGALKILERDSTLLDKLKIITYGNGKIDSRFEVQDLGLFSNSEEQQLIFSAADFYCFTSRAENSPLVVQESLQFGTPVIGFDVGNVSEVLRDDISGRAVKRIEPDALANAINFYIRNYLQKSDPWERLVNTTRRANDFYNSYDSINKHIELYSSKLSKGTISMQAFSSMHSRVDSNIAAYKTHKILSHQKPELQIKEEKSTIYNSPAVLNLNATNNIESSTGKPEDLISTDLKYLPLNVQKLSIDLHSPVIESLEEKNLSTINNLGHNIRYSLSDIFFQYLADSFLINDIALALDKQLVIPLVMYVKNLYSRQISSFTIYIFDLDPTDLEKDINFPSKHSKTLEDLIEHSIVSSNISFDDNIHWTIYNTSTQKCINDCLKLINNFKASNLIIPSFCRANTIEQKFISLLSESYIVKDYNKDNYIKLSRKSMPDLSISSLALYINIVIPVCNNHVQLAMLLSSISRTLKDLEFIKYKINIIMSDSSPDLQLSKSIYHSNKDERLTFICNRLGTKSLWSEAIAEGLRFCRQIYCDFMFIANANIELCEDVIFNMVEAINARANTNALITCCASKQTNNLPVTVGSIFDPKNPNIFEEINSEIFLDVNHPLKDIAVQNARHQSVALSSCLCYFNAISLVTDQLTDEMLPNYKKLPDYWADTEWSFRLFKKHGFLIELISNSTITINDASNSIFNNIVTGEKDSLFSLNSNNNLIDLVNTLDLIKEYFPSDESFKNYSKRLINRCFPEGTD